MLFAKKKDLEFAETQISFLQKRVKDLEKSRNDIEIEMLSKPNKRETKTIGCEGCKVMDAAMRVMSALQFRHSNGTKALGTIGNYRSALRYDHVNQEIDINEEELMQAIIFANPGQKRRKLKLVSEEEFEELNKRDKRRRTNEIISAE